MGTAQHRIGKKGLSHFSFFATVACLAGTALFCSCGTGSARLPVVKKAPDFTLVNQDNKQISLGQFTGKVAVLSFIYARCSMPDMCPFITKNFRQLQSSLAGGPAGNNVVFLLITFDPGSDTPGALKKYGELYGADFSNWHFLTGDKDTIDKVCGDYAIIQEKQEDGSIRHSMIVFIIDQDSNVRKMYVGNKWTPEQLENDVTALL